MNLEEVLEELKKVREGADQAFGEGREDHRRAARRARESRGQDIEGTKIGQMMSSNRTMTLLRELIGLANESDIEARRNMGLGLDDDRAKRTGQILGTLGADLVQDRGRELWWLINAPQALANVALEVGLKKRAPDLYGVHDALDKDGNTVSLFQRDKAREEGFIDENDDTKAGYSTKKNHDFFQKRNYRPGYVDALAIPAGIAVNSGIGLLNPFGGQEGYKAVFESEDDPSKTNNVLGEIGAKYLLGRTGGLLPWEEFKKVRPDVSKGEYMAYKAFKFDNDTDLDLSDGDFVAPTGVLKGTAEGIHGPEVQFLGRSLPVTTALIPTASALIGTVEGARRGSRRGKAIESGMLSGFGGLAAGSIVGNLLENERRRRNQVENERDKMERLGE